MYHSLLASHSGTRSGGEQALKSVPRMLTPAHSALDISKGPTAATPVLPGHHLPKPPAMTTVSSLQVGLDHLQDLEATINHWIHLELCASCIYLSTSFYLDHGELALRNVAADFPHQAHKERDRAEKLMALAGPTRWPSFLQHSKKVDCGDWGEQAGYTGA